MASLTVSNTAMNEVPELTASETVVTTAKPKKGVKRQRKDTTTTSMSSDTKTETTTTSETTEKPETSPACLVVAKSVRVFLKNLGQPCHCGADAIPELNNKERQSSGITDTPVHFLTLLT